MKIIIVILIFLLSSISFGEDVSVRFGKLKISESVGPTSYRFAFVEEANRVPLLTLKQGGIYGIEYSAPENHEYTIQVTAIIPPNVKETGGDLVSTKKEKDHIVMLFKPRSHQGTVVEPFLFSAGDPAGKYTLEVTLNGKLFKTITYQAYVPAAH